MVWWFPDLKKTAETLQEHCWSTGGALEEYCRNIADKVQEYCWNIGGTLQEYCWSTGGALQELVECQWKVGGTLQEHPCKHHDSSTRRLNQSGLFRRVSRRLKPLLSVNNMEARLRFTKLHRLDRCLLDRSLTPWVDVL